jgi:hypothetical protein
VALRRYDVRNRANLLDGFFTFSSLPRSYGLGVALVRLHPGAGDDDVFEFFHSGAEGPFRSRQVPHEQAQFSRVLVINEDAGKRLRRRELRVGFLLSLNYRINEAGVSTLGSGLKPVRSDGVFEREAFERGPGARQTKSRWQPQPPAS